MGDPALPTVLHPTIKAGISVCLWFDYLMNWAMSAMPATNMLTYTKHGAIDLAREKKMHSLPMGTHCKQLCKIQGLIFAALHV